jgi:hypothetical protein
VKGFRARKVDDLKGRGHQTDLKKMAQAWSKAAFNCPGLIGTVHEPEFTAQN